ncbi:MAG: hypothetical protein ACR5K2_05150 [Wolbachia sp.]
MTNVFDHYIINKCGKMPEHESITEFLEKRSGSCLIQTAGSRLSNVSDEQFGGPYWQ